MKFSLLFSVFYCAATAVFGYGDEGHQVIGAIADHLLEGSPAAAHVRALLGDETLSTASTWADQAKGWGHQTEEMHQFVMANPNHAQFHYTDIPFQEPAYREDSIGATNVDVVHAAKACILILQGKPEAQTLFKGIDSKTALRLLVHYVGDIHQPLHVGAGYLDGTNFINPTGYTSHYEADRGGNSLTYEGKNLHFFWDVTAVKTAMTDAHVKTPVEYAKLLLSHPAQDWKSEKPCSQWINEWADQSVVLSAKVHDVAVIKKEVVTDSRTGNVYSRWIIAPNNPNYDAWAAKTVENELTQAGYRLAELLKAIWPEP